MLEHGKHSGPILLIHGGAGDLNHSAEVSAQIKSALTTILKDVGTRLISGSSSAEDAVVAAVKALEDCPLFNAGLGSRLQSDGIARLSASLMESSREHFSAVALATELRNPILLSHALQTRENRSLGQNGAELLANELGIPFESPVTQAAVEEWKKTQAGKKSLPTGTVGAVARDKYGNLAAATSTGGHGTAYPGRLSDVSTPAGNYATGFACISSTGIGEQIIDSGLAVRLETRVRDGKTILQASELTSQEAENKKHMYGWIAIDKNGHWVYSFSTSGMSVGVFTSEHTEPHVRAR